MAVHKRRFNLNLLPLLEALLECRSVSRAAELFNLTQPAASHTLSKLRAAFGDELLVQVGRQMKLTPKAERIRGPVSQLLSLLDEAIESDDLDPAQWSGEFIVATADYVTILLLPELLGKMERETPKISVRVTNITRTSVTNLHNDEIDMLIAPPQIVDDDTLVSRRLFSDRFVVIHAKEHSPPTTLEDYLKRTHVGTVIDAPQLSGSPPRIYSREIESLRSAQHSLAIAPYYSALPLLVVGSTRIALVQEWLAKLFAARFPLSYTVPPIDIPPLDLHLFWSPRFNEDAKHSWMRKAIFDACAGYR